MQVVSHCGVRFGTALTFAFYRAVNLNGAALTLDSNAWADGAAANFTTNGVGFVTTPYRCCPPPMPRARP